jgi:hypothetical protein
MRGAMEDCKIKNQKQCTDLGRKRKSDVILLAAEEGE